MSRWIRSTKDPAWATLLSGYAASAFRLEARQTYSNDAEDAAVARFLSGDAPTLTFDWSIPKIEAQVAAGRRQTTVRVVKEPPTDYTRWELSVFPQFVAAGEDIRILTVAHEASPPDLPEHDFWLFDDREVWRMHYDERHRFTGAELLDEGALGDHLRWRDTALARSVRFEVYLRARHG